MATKHTTPMRLRIQRALMRSLVRFIYHAIANVEITGWENIPEQGPYMVTFNHVSIYDPPLVLSFWPVSSEAIAAEYLWEEKWISLVVRGYGSIPVSRDFFDRSLINKTLGILAGGGILTLSPEGERSFKPGLIPAKPGIAYLAEKAGVPIVPVGVTGTTGDLIQRARRLERPEVSMRIGKPFKLPEGTSKGADRKENRKQNADTVMYKIAELLPEEYRGVYADVPEKVTGEE